MCGVEPRDKSNDVSSPTDELSAFLVTLPVRIVSPRDVTPCATAVESPAAADACVNARLRPYLALRSGRKDDFSRLGLLLGPTRLGSVTTVVAITIATVLVVPPQLGHGVASHGAPQVEQCASSAMPRLLRFNCGSWWRSAKALASGHGSWRMRLRRATPANPP